MRKERPHANSAASLQRRFFQAGGPNLLLLRDLLERLPNVSSYIKDAQGRFMAINRRNRERCGFASESEVIGKRSCDFFSPIVAQHIMERDRKVIETGQPLVDGHDVGTGKVPSDAITISVYPVKDAKGQTIGTACVHYLSQLNTDALHIAPKVQQTVDYLRQHYTESITINELPRQLKISPSTFYRSFTAAIRATPSQYLASLRLSHARELLETTDRTISDIAQDCGFYDHSHFVRIFRRERGITPGEYRQQHRNRQ